MLTTTEIERFVKNIFEEHGSGGHDYDHTVRVYRMAMRIGMELGANLRVLSAAALMHDIGRTREEATGVSHSILSGEMSEEFLRENGYSEREIEAVKSAIRTHRFSEGLQPTSLEGEILSDADKLDAIGAIGVFRAIAHAEVKGVGIAGFLRHADEKLLKLADMMHTKPARRLAIQKHRVLEAFVNELREEIGEVSGLQLS